MGVKLRIALRLLDLCSDHEIPNPKTQSAELPRRKPKTRRNLYFRVPCHEFLEMCPKKARIFRVKVTLNPKSLNPKPLNPKPLLW